MGPVSRQTAALLTVLAVTGVLGTLSILLPLLRFASGLVAAGPGVAWGLWRSAYPALLRSAGVALIATPVALALGLLGGYGIARGIEAGAPPGRAGRSGGWPWPGPGHRHRYWPGVAVGLLVAGRLLPPLAVALPLLQLLRAGITFTFLSGPLGLLTAVYAAFATVLTTGLFLRLFLHVPATWEESVEMLGGTRWQAFRSVLYPQIRREMLALGTLLLAGILGEGALAALFSPLQPTAAALALRRLGTGVTGGMATTVAAVAGLAAALAAWLVMATQGKVLLRIWGVQTPSGKRDGGSGE